MKIEKENLEKNEVRLTFELEQDQVDKALEKAYRKLVKDVQIPGFRKGKVPRHILEARFGEEAFHQDALDELYPQALAKAFQEGVIKEVLDQPKLESYHLKRGEKGTLQIILEVKPEVELGEYTGLDIEKISAEVDEEIVEEQIDLFRKEQATLQETDRDTVEDGDFVLIDFTGYLNGEPFEGGEAEDYCLGIGSNTFIPGFEEQLIGANIGDEREVQVTFPQEYHQEELAGQEVVFKVKIKEIKVRELPPKDDELAQSAGDYETLDELREDVKNKIQQQMEEQVRIKFENDVMEAVAKDIDMHVPDSMVDQRLETLYKETEADYKKKNIELEEYLEAQGLSKEKWEEEYRPSARRQVRNQLILEAVADREDLTVSPEELEETLKSIIEGSDIELETFKQSLEKQGSLELLIKDLRRQKAMEFLKENNQAPKA